MAAASSVEGQAALAVRMLKRLSTAAASSPGTTTKNLIFSPLSIHAALALVAAGARGRTLDEILDVLGAPSQEALARFVGAAARHTLADRSHSGGPRVALACGAWCDASRPLRPAFRDPVAESYKATAATVDFQNKPEEACEQINAWVASATQNLIPSVLDPHEPGMQDAIVVLASAIFFKGQWQDRFRKKDTKGREFFLLNGSTTVEVPFMQSWSDQYIACHDGFKVLKMPYMMRNKQTTSDNDCWDKETLDRVHAMLQKLTRKYNGVPDDEFEPSQKKKNKPARKRSRHGSKQKSSRKRSKRLEKENCSRDEEEIDLLPEFSMCVFLPDEHDGLQGLIDRIASNKGFLLNHLPEQRVAVGTFFLPRFKLSFSGSVTGVLRDLGLRLPFDPEKASLSGMVDAGCGLPVFIQGVLHRAVVEVDEEGSKAAAVTMADAEIGCDMDEFDEEEPKVIDFVADHPFAFFVVEERSGSIVFAGQVVDPSLED